MSENSLKSVHKKPTYDDWGGGMAPWPPLGSATEGRDTIQARRKTLTLLYDKFTQNNMYQILSQVVRFCRLYKTFWCVHFSVHSVELLVDSLGQYEEVHLVQFTRSKF